MHPQALLWRDANTSPVAEHLKLLGLSRSVITRVHTAFPAIDSLASADSVASVLAYLQSELDLSTAALGKLVGAYPQVLGLSLESNVRPTVEFVKRLGAAPKRAFTRHPQLFGLAVETNLRDTATYLQELGVDVGRAVDRHPPLLSLSLTHMRSSVAFFHSIGMKELGRVLTTQPTLLSLSVEQNLRPKVDFLSALGLARAPGGLGPQLAAYPALLTLSLESNLQPTADALRRAGLIDDADEASVSRDGDGGGGTAVAAPATTLRPRHLAASLDGRVKPRLAFCELRRSADAVGALDSWAERAPTLSVVTTISDAAFAAHVGSSAEEYADFKRAWLDDGAGVAPAPPLNISWLPDGIDLNALVLESQSSDVASDVLGSG